VVVDLVGGRSKAALALDKESENGQSVGAELEIGDVLSVILKFDTKAQRRYRRNQFAEALATISRVPGSSKRCVAPGTMTSFFSFFI
jgi:hypothetical protein